MARTTKADLYAANVIKCAPNGIMGVFGRWEDNRWHHQDADESCASYSDDEMYDRCNGNIDIISYMQN